MIYRRDNALVISDKQIPFEDPDALKFCLAVAKEFNVPLKPDNRRSAGVYDVGDEDDQYWMGRWPKSPNAPFTATGEVELVKKRFRPWKAAFPYLKICQSNHGKRYEDRADEAGIPSQLIKHKRQWLDLPDTWHWSDEWHVKGPKHHWRLIHGVGYSGQMGHINATVDAGISTVIGHLSSFAGVARIETRHKYLWAANSGCLVSRKPDDLVGLKYGKDMRRRPTRGVIVVIDGGLTPIFIPFERM